MSSSSSPRERWNWTRNGRDASPTRSVGSLLASSCTSTRRFTTASATERFAWLSTGVITPNSPSNMDCANDRFGISWLEFFV